MVTWTSCDACWAVCGYEQSGGVYGSLDRRAIFVGDLIDRGPAIGEVMEIVAGMLRPGGRTDRDV